MSIQYCTLCKGSKTAKVYRGYRVEEVRCPSCWGAGKWRPAGESFTPILEVDRQALEDLAWMKAYAGIYSDIDHEIGRLAFVFSKETLAKLEPDVMLEMMRRSGRACQILEQNNWLV
jgi:hypothetical protein